MKTDSANRPTARDHAAFRNTLLKLTATHKIVSIAVTVVVALIWYSLVLQLITFGQGLDYSGLDALGTPIATTLKRYNPFFWWALAALCTLIIAYFLVGFVRSSRRRVNARLVKTETVAALAAQLSEPAKTVMRWVWDDTRFPLTVGDLQQTANELRNNRAEKIKMAQDQSALLAPAEPEKIDTPTGRRTA